MADYPGLTHPAVLVDLSASGTGSPELRGDGYVNNQFVATLLMSSDSSRDPACVTEAASVDFRTSGTTPPAGPGGGVSSPITSAPPPTPSPPRPVRHRPTRARIRTVLLRALTPTGHAARIETLTRGSGYSVCFSAPSTGKLEIDWYRVVARRHRRPHRVLVASPGYRSSGRGE